MYILGSIAKYNVIQHNHFDNDDGFYWAKDYIEKAFVSITTGSCLSYSKKDQFSVYQGQTLTPENKVYMDLFEILIYGDNNWQYNRADDLPESTLNQIRISLYTLNNLLTANDSQTMIEKKQLALAYDELFV